jgi:hypothetical protein
MIRHWGQDLPRQGCRHPAAARFGRITQREGATFVTFRSHGSGAGKLTDGPPQ